MEMRDLLAITLEGEGYDVSVCGKGSELAWHINTSQNGAGHPFDLVVSDIRMPGATALDVMQGLEGRQWPPVILITAFGSPETHERARKLGAAAVLDKPFELDDFIDLVNRWVRQHGACER